MDYSNLDKNPISVSEFIDTFNEANSVVSFCIEGEVGEIKVRGRGVYIKLTDKKAVLNCFMFLFQFKSYKDIIEEGMKIRAFGHGELHYLYNFSFRISRIELAGEGSFARAFELLKIKLEKEGIFDEDRKRAIKKFPKNIGIITSANGAALTDFLKRVDERFGGATIKVIDTYMEGGKAVNDIISSIEWFNANNPDLDVLVITRGGGGKLESLASFNDEQVVKSIYGSKIPVLCAIGHERDVTLAELAADFRASTPTHAVDILYPPKEEVLESFERMKRSLNFKLESLVSAYSRDIDGTLRAASQYFSHIDFLVEKNINKMYNSLNLESRKAMEFEKNLNAVNVSLKKSLERWKNNIFGKIENIQRLVYSFSPDNALKKGYSIVRDKDNNIINSGEKIKAGDIVNIELFKGLIKAIVNDIKL